MERMQAALEQSVPLPNGEGAAAFLALPKAAQTYTRPKQLLAEVTC